MAEEMTPMSQTQTSQPLVAKKKKTRFIILAIIVAIILAAAGLYCYLAVTYQYVELKDLITNPSDYKDKKIAVDATHCTGFEISSIGIKGYKEIFLDDQTAQVFNRKHLTTSPSGCKEARIYGTFHHTDATIPTEDVIKVIVGGFGHMGSYASELEADIVFYK